MNIEVWAYQIQKPDIYPGQEKTLGIEKQKPYGYPEDRKTLGIEKQKAVWIPRRE